MIGQIERYFEPIEIHVKQDGYDDWGNPISGVYKYNETIQGRMRQLGGAEQYSSQGTTHVSTHRMYCLPTIISQSDRIVYRGQNYNVTNINNVMNFDRLLQVDLEVVQDGN